MAKRQLDEITKALRDMPRWRAETARSFFWYALLIAFLAVLLLAQMWLFRHKIISKFAQRPLMTLFMLGGTAYAVVACVSIVRVLFSARRGLIEHNKTMAELEAARHSRPEA